MNEIQLLVAKIKLTLGLVDLGYEALIYAGCIFVAIRILARLREGQNRTI